MAEDINQKKLTDQELEQVVGGTCLPNGDVSSVIEQLDDYCSHIEKYLKSKEYTTAFAVTDMFLDEINKDHAWHWICKETEDSYRAKYQEYMNRIKNHS